MAHQAPKSELIVCFILILVFTCFWIGIQPGLAILDCFHNLLLLVIVELLTESLVFTRTLSSGTHGVQVAIECILGVNALADLPILISELLCILDHLLNLLLSQSALVIGNGDLLTLAGPLVLGTNIQDTVGINLESDLNLRLTARSRW